MGTSVERVCAHATSPPATCQSTTPVSDCSTPLQAHVLQRPGVREAPDEIDPGLGHAGAHAPDEGQLVDRHVRDAIVQDLLDLMHERLALLDVGLARLALEEV